MGDLIEPNHAQPFAAKVFEADISKPYLAFAHRADGH